MFCKWCGNPIQPTDKICPSCGRETPPMPDCGGFYNLKYDSSGHVDRLPEPPHTDTIQEEHPVTEKKEPKYARDRKASQRHHTMTMVCFAAFLAALACTAIFAAGMNHQLNEIGKQLLGIQADLTASGAEDREAASSATGSSAEHVPHNFVLGVTVGKTSGTEIGVSYDLGDYAKTVKVAASVAEGENGQKTAVSFILNEDAAINLNLISAQEKADTLIWGVKCDSDLYFFDSQALTYEWQYRTGAGPWTPAAQDIVTQNNEDYRCIACRLDWIQSICTAEQPIELRCNIQMKNASGDSVVLTVDGIFAAADGTLVTTNP